MCYSHAQPNAYCCQGRGLGWTRAGPSTAESHAGFGLEPWSWSRTVSNSSFLRHVPYSSDQDMKVVDRRVVRILSLRNGVIDGAADRLVLDSDVAAFLLLPCSVPVQRLKEAIIQGAL